MNYLCIFKRNLRIVFLIFALFFLNVSGSNIIPSEQLTANSLNSEIYYSIIVREKVHIQLINEVQRYINEKDIEHEENTLVHTSPKTSQDDDVDQHVRSISLFSE